MAAGRDIVMLKKNKRFLVSKQEWMRRTRFLLGKSKAEAKISWTHATKGIEDDVVYGIWKGELNVLQWPAKADTEWGRLTDAMNAMRLTNDTLNRASSVMNRAASDGGEWLAGDDWGEFNLAG